jgi:hypothetical protein
MVMLTAIAVLLSLVFIGWLIWWAVRRKPIKAHVLMYLLSTLAGVYTLAFFLSMDIPTILKVVVSIILGATFIFLAAYSQRQREAG